jgi:hypothetical protein
MFPAAEQGVQCIILCQFLTGTFTPIFVVRLDERTGHIFILAGDTIAVEIPCNGIWRLL